MSSQTTEPLRISLKSCIDPAHFRTVESFLSPGSPKETKVTLLLQPSFLDTLSFPVPGAGKLFGYAWLKPGFTALCFPRLDISQGCTLTLEDWDTDFFLLVQSTVDNRETGFLVSSQEVTDLLEHCLRIEAQKLWSL